METASRRARTPHSAARLAAAVAGGIVLVLIAPTVAAAPAAEPSRWTAPVNLSANGGSSPDLAVSADGSTAVATWLRKKEGHRIVQVRAGRIADGVVRWSPKQDLTAVGSPFANSPEVAVSGDGETAIVVWTSGHTSVRSRTADIDRGAATWAPRQTVAASTGDDRVLWPQLVMSRDGSTAVAAWNLYDGSAPYGTVVQSSTARISRDGASWQPTQDLAPAGSFSDQPELGVSRDGSTAIAVWTNRNVQSSTARISDGVATWGATQDVSPPSGALARVPQVALSADGSTVVAAWADQDPDGTGHVVRSRTAAVSGGAPPDWAAEVELLSGAQGGYGPHVAISRDGARVVAVWIAASSDGAVAQSRAASIQAGTTTWSAVQQLSAPGDSAAGSHVALSADGTRAVALWSIDGVRSRTASLTAGTATWERRRLVSEVGEGPLLGTSRNGRTAVAAWNRGDGSRMFKTILQSASAHDPR